ncbi:MAG: LacI family transcriptional regulator [Clostridiales bacterium]|nr:LacI family transcriptional regulator [Clostridiales bacterium]
MVALKDIAQRCGVSTATVSKALNGHHDVGEKTRKRIQKVADEMGYLPNSAARALKTDRTYNLGVLFVDEQQSGLTHEFFSAVLDSFKVEAEAHGYDITFISHNTGGRTRTYLQHCLYRGVDGVVVACVDFRTPQVQELVNSAIPVVTIDYMFNNRMAVLSDNAEGVDALVRYAYDQGHRKIAFIHGELTSVTEKRLSSFYRTCDALGLDVPEEYILESPYHDGLGCKRLTKQLLELPDRPTCILFPDDYSYIGGLSAIEEAGLKIPEDISTIGYDGIYLSHLLHPSLTTYRQNTKALGQVAAQKLIDLIEYPKRTLPEQVVVSGQLLIGGSVGVLSQQGG